MSIILASGSPRRKELMHMLGFADIKIIPAKGEELAPEGATPGELVEALSGAKAREVAQSCATDDLVVAADTIVWFAGRVYGKPKDAADAERMLAELSGNVHEVYTGVTLIKGERTLTAHEVTRVCFRPLEAAEIRGYVATGEPLDKAGAYGAQGLGALLVRGIEGDFFNVMGLPVCTLGAMLKTMGVEIL